MVTTHSFVVEKMHHTHQKNSSKFWQATRVANACWICFNIGRMMLSCMSVRMGHQRRCGEQWKSSSNRCRSCGQLLRVSSPTSTKRMPYAVIQPSPPHHQTQTRKRTRPQGCHNLQNSYPAVHKATFVTFARFMSSRRSPFRS